MPPGRGQTVSSLKRNQLNGNKRNRTGRKVSAKCLFTEEKPIEWKFLMHPRTEEAALSGLFTEEKPIEWKSLFTC